MASLHHNVAIVFTLIAPAQNRVKTAQPSPIAFCLLPAPDSLLHPGLYDSVMATNHQAVSATMQIGELARSTSLTVEAIRFYEKASCSPRLIAAQAVPVCTTKPASSDSTLIQQMQGLGFSLSEVGELIRLRGRKVEACESVKQLPTAKRVDVRAKMGEVRRLESEFEVDVASAAVN
jgi:hypothetical protein